MTPTMKFWVAVVGIGLTGIVTRCSFLLFGERLVLPRGVERALRATRTFRPVTHASVR
ncbi:MAG: hypothetical protein NTZ79_10390 [Proteobacteria bacterium]|nr:hypothetical protein [Pseudomonadota bacterium]